MVTTRHSPGRTLEQVVVVTDESPRAAAEAAAIVARHYHDS